MNHLELAEKMMSGEKFTHWIVAVNLHLEAGEYPLAVHRMLSSGVLAQYQKYEGAHRKYYVEDWANKPDYYGVPGMTLVQIDRVFLARVFDMPYYDLLGVKRELEKMVADMRYDESVDMLTAGEDWQWDYVRTLLGYVDTLVWVRNNDMGVTC